MGVRFPDARLVKIHRNYTIEELARVLRVHKNTARRWQTAGLRALDTGRPKLFHGTEVRRFLEARRQQARHPCPPGHLYCFGCRAPKPPLDAEVDLLPRDATIANLCGICACGTLMYRRVSPRTLATARQDFIITIPQARSRIGGKACPSLNGDFNETWSAHLDAQPQE